MPLIVFFFIGILVASQKWHMSFFIAIMVLTVIYFILYIVIEVKQALRIRREDEEIAKRFEEKYGHKLPPSAIYKPEPQPIGGYLWFSIISCAVIWIFALCTGN